MDRKQPMVEAQGPTSSETSPPHAGLLIEPSDPETGFAALPCDTLWTLIPVQLIWGICLLTVRTVARLAAGLSVPATS